MRSFLAALAMASVAGAGWSQAQAAAPAFEVASIKPSPPLDPNAILSGKMHVGMKTDAGRVDIGFLSLADLIRVAYRVKPYQISGPDWMSGQRFDIQAKIPEGVSTEQVPEMLQALLAERFGLTIHRDKTDQPVYALMVGKNGPKLKDAPPDPPASDTPVEPPKGAITIGSGSDQVSISGNPRSGQGLIINSAQSGKLHMAMGEDGAMELTVEKMSMPAFADALTQFVGRPVVDATGLKGNYQIALSLSLNDLMAVARSSGLSLPGVPSLPAGQGAGAMARPADAASDPGSSSIFTAVERLGLKLDSQKQPMDRIVVDHLEKAPTEN
ncbi:MAG TPA: TIGR03435 family protein [Bryobacteraceae bacterium]|nr:TIGR03435 family protein [Bryobacteraceae bacterium]